MHPGQSLHNSYQHGRHAECDETAAQLSKGNDMDTAIQLATIAASYSVSKEGVQNAIISPDLLEDLFSGDYALSAITKE